MTPAALQIILEHYGYRCETLVETCRKKNYADPDKADFVEVLRDFAETLGEPSTVKEHRP